MSIKNKAAAKMKFGASLDMTAKTALGAAIRQHYKIECVRNGKVVWAEEFDNLVVTAGRK